MALANRQQPPQDFSEKIVLVTGGTSGIGRATAELFAARGASVALVGTNADRGRETVRAIEQLGQRVIFINADLRRPEAAEESVRKTVDAFGALHCAFNNAGRSHPPSPFIDVTLEQWNETIALDQTCTFLCMQHEIRQMLKSGGGAIVNNSSISGLTAHPGMAAYVSAKHATIALTRVAASEYARQNVRVNVICPGGTDTPM